MVWFDGSQSADTGLITDRSKTFRSPKIFIQEDHPICVHSGFCRDTVSDIWSMRCNSTALEVLAQIIDKLNNCPFGAPAYALESGGEIIEPELAEEVVVIPGGPLWVTGGVRMERSDGRPLEIRNRVTLCRCGASAIKPLCDGTHKEIGFTDS